MFLTSLKQICNEYLIKFSENQSAPKLENRKTPPCSPCAPNLLHVLVSRILGCHNLCSPVFLYFLVTIFCKFLLCQVADTFCEVQNSTGRVVGKCKGPKKTEDSSFSELICLYFLCHHFCLFFLQKLQPLKKKRY